MLVYFSKNGYDVSRLKPYEDFLLECKQKDIESYAKHKHHILPVFMGGGNEPDNFIELTPDDHYNAHLVLAECFEKGMPEHHYNISSAHLIMRLTKRFLNKAFKDNVPTNLSDFWKKANIHMKDAMKGENSHMFGKTHPEEWRENHSKMMTGYRNPNFGKDGNFKGKSHDGDTKTKMSISAKKSWTKGRRDRASETQSIAQKGLGSGFKNNNSIVVHDTVTGNYYMTRKKLFEEFDECKMTDIVYRKFVDDGRFLKIKKKVYDKMEVV